MKNSVKKDKEISPLPSNPNSKSKLKFILTLLLLVVAVCVVYWQVQECEFINLDDPEYVTENPNINKGFSYESIVWAFTTTRAANWHPVTWLSHILDYQFYGLNPLGHHLTNILFHIANVLLLFIVLFQMTGCIGKSCFVALLFAVHPLNVESVAWVAERKNVLSTFFWLLTMWAYVRYAKNKSAAKYLLALVFFSLGLMSKPMLVTLPFVLFMLDYWPLNRLRIGEEKNSAEKGNNFIQLGIEKFPFLILVVASCVITFVAQKSSGAVQSAEIYPWRVRIVNALVSYFEYLEKMVWPKSLSILYPHQGNLLPTWKGVVCVIALFSISTFALKKVREAPYFTLGWYWYLGTLVPVIGIVQVGGQAMADRYTYIPLVGIFISIAWGIPALLKRYKLNIMTLPISAGIIVSILSAITWSQLSHWGNSVSLFKHAVEVSESKSSSFSLVHINLGAALEEKNKVQDAIDQYREAVRLDPRNAKAHYDLGTIIGKQGNYDEAISHLKIAAEIDSNNPLVHNNLGLALSFSGNYELAIDHFKEALRINPNYAGAKKNLSYALMITGR
jgi:tetratricopeptide (TPR) repeat protein